MRSSHSQKGYAMVLAICVTAILTALSLAMLLTASIVLRSAQSENDKEQCRVLALSLSQELEGQITDSACSFSTQAEEEAARNDSLWFYLKDHMTDGSWPYFNEDERGHTARYAHRTFRFDSDTLPASVTQAVSEVGDTEVVMYWESESGAALDAIPLTVSVTCSSGGSACTITTEYMLSVSERVSEQTDPDTGEVSVVKYDQWKWSLNWRE